MKKDSDTEIQLEGKGRLVLKFIQNNFNGIKGRAWLLKKIVKLFPEYNNASLRIGTIIVPLDLKNDADIGYFFRKE